jgi:hypothetical protein
MQPINISTSIATKVDFYNNHVQHNNINKNFSKTHYFLPKSNPYFN